MGTAWQTCGPRISRIKSPLRLSGDGLEVRPKRKIKGKKNTPTKKHWGETGCSESLQTTLTNRASLRKEKIHLEMKGTLFN